jgi:hypothetical protein
MTPLERGLAVSARRYMKLPIHIIAEALHRDHRTIEVLMARHNVKIRKPKNEAPT